MNFGELTGREADAARRAVHQNRLAGLRAGFDEERAICSHVGDGERRALLESDA